MKNFVITLGMLICSSVALASLPFEPNQSVVGDILVCTGTKFDVSTKAFESADGKTTDPKIIYAPTGTNKTTFASAGTSGYFMREYKGTTEKNVRVELDVNHLNGSSGKPIVDGVVVDNEITCHDAF